MLTRRRFLIKENGMKLTVGMMFRSNSGDLIEFAQEKISGLLKVLSVGNKILLPQKWR